MKLKIWIISFLIVFLALAAIPWLGMSIYILSILTLANLYMIYAASWDLVSGYTGQLNLGQALFIGVSAFTVGILGDKINPWVLLPLGGLVSVVFALIVGVPCLRLKGPYLGLTTLVIPLIMERLAFTFRDFTGGEYGLMVSSPFNRVELYYLSLSLALITLITLLIIVNSRVGRVLLAIREDDVAAAAAGNDVARYKLIAFITSAFFTGLGAVVLTYFLRHVGPGSFSMWVSMNIVLMGIVGGMGTIIGPAIGGYLLIVITELLRSMREMQDLIFSIILIVAVLVFPKGLAGLKRSLGVVLKGRPESERKYLKSNRSL
ncbi:MAG: branched-chain amino acid ABC transporter permease [Desulfocucumaceae bacterium]